MKDNKSDIVRIHDDGMAGKVAAEKGIACAVQKTSGVIQQDGGADQDGGTAQDDGASPVESSANEKDRSIYGGDRPINLKFPLCLEDIWIGYIVFPIVLLCLAAIQYAAWKPAVRWLFFGDALNLTDVLMGLLFCMLSVLGIVWFVYSWFVDYYRKWARSIDIDPATKTFHVRNFVLTRGKNCRPAFYPELTFTLDDVRKVYFKRAATSPVMIAESGVYIVIPEGYLFVYGKTNEFLRMKYFLLVEAEGKNEATRSITLDGVFRHWERF